MSRSWFRRSFPPNLQAFFYDLSLDIILCEHFGSSSNQSIFGQTASFSCKGHLFPPQFTYTNPIYHRTLSSHWMTIQLLRTEPRRTTRFPTISTPHHTTSHTTPRTAITNGVYPFFVFFTKTLFVYTYRERGIYFYSKRHFYTTCQIHLRRWAFLHAHSDPQPRPIRSIHFIHQPPHPLLLFLTPFFFYLFFTFFL